MKRRIRIFLVVFIVCVLCAAAYAVQASFRHAVAGFWKPSLPPAEPYTPATSTAPITATSTVSTPPRSVPIPVTSRSAPDPAANLPKEKLLAVPFMSQSPLQDWTKIGEDACEEASVLMVRGYYEGKTKRYDPRVAERLIQDLVAFEKKTYGFFESTSATATKQWIEAYAPELRAEIMPVTDADSIKAQIALGRPVVLFADGKALHNPNFKNGGPVYHAFVVRGYTKDGRFITNDPGTRKGEGYLYDSNVVLNAVHDWNNGDVPHGRRVMLIVTPRI